MCKFFTVDLYDHIKDYDYYFRVDSDNVLVPPSYDIFNWVETHDIEYGYVVRKFEPHKPTRTTLPSFVKQYIQKCDLTNKIPIQQPPIDDMHIFNFYNNLHLGKISFFNSPQVRNFLIKSNATGLYENRWGDSTIQAYAVRLFMQPWQVQQLPNISYYHMSHSSALVTSDPRKVTKVPQVFPSGNWTIDAQLTNFDLVRKKSGSVPAGSGSGGGTDVRPGVGMGGMIPSLSRGGRGGGGGGKGKGKGGKMIKGKSGKAKEGNKKRMKAMGEKLLE